MARAAIVAVKGDDVVTRFLEKGDFPRPQSSSNRIFILAAGKASAAMAKAAEDYFLDGKAGAFGDGLAITKDGHGLKLRKTRVLEAAHPIPDERGLKAAQAVLRY